MSQKITYITSMRVRSASLIAVEILARKRDVVRGWNDAGRRSEQATHNRAATRMRAAESRGQLAREQHRGIGGEDRLLGSESSKPGVYLAFELQPLRDGLDHEVGIAHRFRKVR